jgi:hypothetical protein
VKSGWSRAIAVAVVIAPLAALAIYGYSASHGVTYFLLQDVDGSYDPVGSTELWADSAGHRAQEIGYITIDAACAEPVVSDLRLLSDGTSGAVVDCDDATYFATVDLASRPPMGHVVTQLPSPVFTVAWDPSARKGWAGYAEEGRCGGIGTLTTRGVGSFHPAGIGWPLDKDLYAGNDTCSGDGLASQPVLAPGGRVLYFIAAPPTLRTITGSIPDWTLYAYDIGSRAVTAVMPGLRDLGGFDVAGDGSTIVIAAKHGRTSGLWLINTKSHAAVLLSDRNLLDPRFASADQVLALEQDVDHDALVKLPIS